jgi:hypothetical protein
MIFVLIRFCLPICNFFLIFLLFVARRYFSRYQLIIY